MCYAKIHVKERLLGTGIAADTEIARLLHDEFPEALIVRTGAMLSKHRLAEEIICTQAANDLVHHAIVDELLTHQGQICSRVVLEATGHGQGSDAIGAKLAQIRNPARAVCFRVARGRQRRAPRRH